MPTPPSYPNDEKLGVFAHIIDFTSKNWLTRPVLNLLNTAFFSISPSVPSTFCDTLHSRPTRRALGWGYGLTFLFCFVAVTVWSMVDGTFSGTNPGRIYFSHDLTNIINYAVLSPLYVGLSAQLVVLLVVCWAKLSSPLIISTVGEPPRLPRASLGLTVFIVFTVSAASTINFIRECLDPNMYSRIGWWVGKVSTDGSRILSPLGIYYILLNFTLLSVCTIAALSFISLFFLCIRLGVLIRNQPVSSELDFESLREILSQFTQAYIVLKLLAVALVLNAYTWSLEVIHSSLNFRMMTTVIVLFGVFFISVPRYYIELEWFRFRVRRAVAVGQTYNLERDDIRPFNVRLTAWICDSIILSGFLFSWLRFMF